ncbi:hypothetical protein HZS_7736 [Henneguya salminicola]|nr:hypothetical protein HZS_7736 [Henneguya salminicola]
MKKRKNCHNSTNKKVSKFNCLVFIEKKPGNLIWYIVCESLELLLFFVDEFENYGLLYCLE